MKKSIILVGDEGFQHNQASFIQPYFFYLSYSSLFFHWPRPRIFSHFPTCTSNMPFFFFFSYFLSFNFTGFIELDCVMVVVVVVVLFLFHFIEWSKSYFRLSIFPHRAFTLLNEVKETQSLSFPLLFSFFWW